MATRTTRKAVTFPRAFMLVGMDGNAPAGCDAMEADEGRLASLSFSACCRHHAEAGAPARAGEGVETGAGDDTERPLNAAFKALQVSLTRNYLMSQT